MPSFSLITCSFIHKGGLEAVSEDTKVCKWVWPIEWQVTALTYWSMVRQSPTTLLPSECASPTALYDSYLMQLLGYTAHGTATAGAHEQAMRKSVTWCGRLYE